MSDPSARDAILDAVRAALPPAVARPAPREQAAPLEGAPSPLDAFVAAATVAGAAVVLGDRSDVARLVSGAALGAREVLSLIAEVPSTVPVVTDPHALASLDLFVCESNLGVGENGAVWITTSDPLHRAALFLAQRVTIVVAAASIVADLHQAYERIDVRAHAFGAFIAGPSKTADIEQSLVIGAHGPKELTLIVVGEPDTASEVR